MKYIFKISTMLLVSLALFSCGSDDGNNKSNDGDLNLDNVLRKVDKSRESGGKKAEAIVKKYQGSLDQLFTKEMAAAVTGYNVADVEENYSKTTANPDYHDISYSWDKGRVRKMKVGGMNFEVPSPDILRLGWFRATTLEQFKQSYRTPTEEELQNMEEALNENTAGNPNAQLATDMAKGFADGLTFDDVPGVGDYAVWNNKTKELNTYYKGIQFQLQIVVGDNAEVNRERSIALAKMIVDKL